MKDKFIRNILTDEKIYGYICDSGIYVSYSY